MKVKEYADTHCKWRLTDTTKRYEVKVQVHGDYFRHCYKDGTFFVAKNGKMYAVLVPYNGLDDEAHATLYELKPLSRLNPKLKEVKPE